MDTTQAQSLIFKAIDTLAEQLEHDSEQLTRFLKVMAQFHRYSVFNQILIMCSECPMPLGWLAIVSLADDWDRHRQER